MADKGKALDYITHMSDAVEFMETLPHDTLRDVEGKEHTKLLGIRF